MKVFLDTNVLVAAFATRGLCADVLRTALAEHEVVLSLTVIRELTRTLSGRIGVPEATVREIEAFLGTLVVAVGEPVRRSPVPVRDPDDAVILGEAIAIGADVLVTGDKDLLDLEEIQEIKVLDPRGFWELVRLEVP